MKHLNFVRKNDIDIHYKNAMFFMLFSLFLAKCLAAFVSLNND